MNAPEESNGAGETTNHQGYLSTITELTKKVTDEGLLFILAICIVLIIVATVVTVRLPSSSSLTFALSVVGAIVFLAIAGLLVMRARASQRAVEAQDESAQANLRANVEPVSKAEPKRSSSFQLSIGRNGSFVGGDEQAVAFTVDVLEVAAHERSIKVAATPLEDHRLKILNPSHFRRLKKGVREYETALNALFSGRVRYVEKWHAEDLAEAVLELRRLALPPIDVPDRESWCTWPVAKPDHAIKVGFDSRDVSSINSCAFDFPSSGEIREKGIPTTHPVWLRQIDPRIAWTRVAPAVVFDLAKSDPAPDQVVDISNYVLSHVAPGSLEHAEPTYHLQDRQTEWTW